MNGQSVLSQITLRDWFASHAPPEPWPDFEPVMPPAPEAPSVVPVGNDGEAPTEDELSSLTAWRRDPCWDVELEHPQFSNWVRAWHAYLHRAAEHSETYRRERLAQWPYYYADTMLRMRSRIAPTRETP